MLKSSLKHFFFSTILTASVLNTTAQGAIDQRALSTKIADVLALMPARDKAQLNKNMEAIAATGETGVAEMAGMLSPAGKGDNTSLEFAIAGYSAYVTQPGKEALRQAAVKAYAAALDKTPDTWNKEFLIRQLQLTGNEDAIPALAKYLSDEQLSGAATRGLAQIHSDAAEKVLLDAVAKSGGVNQQAIVEALGYSQYAPALPLLGPLANNRDKKLRKVALYALARIADPSSAATLSGAAKAAGYTFDETDATAAYLLYLKNISTKGADAEKLSTELLQQAAAANQYHTRTAALKLLVDIKKENSLPLLLQAMKDTSGKYRAAALAFAAQYQSPAVNKQWLQSLAGGSPAASAQVIRALGNTGDNSLVQPLSSSLKQKDTAVKIAAITAIGKLGQQSALPVLLPLLKNATPAETNAIVSAIQTMKGDDVTAQVATAIDKASPSARAALIRVLAARGANQYADKVYSQLSTKDTTLRSSAIAALPSMSRQENLPALFDLLNTATAPQDVQSLQRAIIAASSGITDTARRTSLITEQLKGNFNGKQYLLVDVLGGIGGKDALKELNNLFEKGDEATKKASIDALAKAGGAGAASALLAIARQPSNQTYAKAALAGFLQLIPKSGFTGDQKLLMLQEAMQLSPTDAQKKAIFREVARCNTFPAVIYAGKFLADPVVQAEAASAVSVIVLANKEFTGNIVRSLLTKSAGLLKGGDADYERKAIVKHLADMPSGEGFVPIFNEKDLTGWKGLVADPVKRSKMSADTLAAQQEKANLEMKDGWEAKDGMLIFKGHGNNLATVKQYGDFEMYIDWKITKDGDAGIYLRGSPQVQIWDTARRNVGAQVGSGGLYNNQKNPAKPLKVADNPVGEWNNFHIIMKGDKVTVFLNGELVTDSVTLENYWDRSQPIYPREQLELQAHGTLVAYRNIYVREFSGSQPFVISEEEKKDGFKVLFDGTNLDQWTGNKIDYVVDNGDLLVNPQEGAHGNLYTKDEYSDFVFRFEFQLTPGANNGLGIRAPLEGDAAYVGMELQILDNTADIYKNLKPFQYHGSVYGIIPSKKGFLKPLGEWNYEEVIAKGPKIKVILNGEVILDGDIKQAVKKGTPDGHEHPGLMNPKGHIGFLGHGSVLRFRNIRIKELAK